MTTTTQVIYVNVSDTNTISEVWVEIDSATNYTMTDDTGDRYNYSISFSTVGSHSYKAYMNDSAGNLNSTSRISFDIAAPYTPGGTPSGGGGTSPPSAPPPPIEPYNYSVTSGDITMSTRVGLYEEYYSLVSYDNRTIDLEMTVECYAADDSCSWFNFITRRTQLDEEYNELSAVKSIYLLPHTKGDVLYSLNIPASTPLGTYQSTILLTDQNEDIKKINVKLIVSDSIISTEIPFFDFFENNIPYAIVPESRLSNEYNIKYGDVVYAIVGLIAIGLVWRLVDYIFTKRKKKYESP